MKKTAKFLAMSLMGAFAMGFTSCSDSDDGYPTVYVSEAEMQQAAQDYVNVVVNPTYTDLADAANELCNACATLYSHANSGSWSQTEIDAACEAFKKARREWERSEAFLYGAATDYEIDPHIDSWPLDRDQLEEALTDNTLMTGIKGSNPGQFVYTQNGKFDSVIGFHGLEFVLFRNGANRSVADLQGNEANEGMPTVTGLDELAFAAAVSEDIRNMTTLLEYAWVGESIVPDHQTVLTNANWVIDNLKESALLKRTSGNKFYGAYLLASTTSNGYFPTWQEAMENVLVGGCANISNEVYQQKLGQAYRVATGQGGVTEDGEAESIDYIESPYSKRSFIDYLDNIYSIKNVLYGTRNVDASSPATNSLMTIMNNYDYPRYSALSSALRNAISALSSAANSGTAFADDPDNAQVKTCIDAVNNLDDELNEAGKWFRRNVVVVSSTEE